MTRARTLIHAMILPAVLVAAAPVAKAEDHRAEIMARVVDRCYPATVRWRLLEARRKGNAGISEADMIRTIRTLKAAPHTERLITALAETVRGHDAQTRARLYDIAFVECFLSGVGTE